MKLLHTIRQLQKWGIFHMGVPPSWSEKNPSFEQNIRASKRVPAFQMKLLASFIIPPANFLTHITNRGILDFLPLPKKLFPMVTEQHCAHPVLVLPPAPAQNIWTLDHPCTNEPCLACMFAFHGHQAASLSLEIIKCLIFLLNICSGDWMTAWKLFWLNEGWGKGQSWRWSHRWDQKMSPSSLSVTILLQKMHQQSPTIKKQEWL